MTRSRKGKIARLPAAIREELNRRLLDGQPASTILPWLNALPETAAILSAHFHGEPISPQNLTEWRQGGYTEWLAQRQRIEHLRSLSAYAADLARAAGGSLSEGAAAIAGGRILQLLEDLPPDRLDKLVAALSSLRSSEAAALNARTAQARLAQKERELALAEQKFRRRTAEMFLQWAASPDARAILDASDPRDIKLDRLVHLMFGAPPQPPPQDQSGEHAP